VLNKKIDNYLKENFSLDKRALALMRIGVAVIILFDLVIRCSSLDAHYTDKGVLPTSALEQLNGHGAFSSLEGTVDYQVTLFSLAFAFALFLLFGIKTRLTTFVCWLLISLIHYRNPVILQGGDDLLRLTLFWGIFLPWGHRYSADARSANRGSNNYFGLPALGFALLVFSVYFFSAILKDSSEWRSDASALYYALSLDQLALPLGKMIYPHGNLLRILTHLTWYSELIAPLLLFIPWKNHFFRTCGITIIILLHCGIGLTLYVGIFFSIGIVTAIGLLPGPVMDKLLKRFPSPGNQPEEKSNGNTIIGKLNANYYSRLLINCVVLFLICFNLLINLSSVPGLGLRISDNFIWINRSLNFNQKWSMFAPNVLKEDGWYILAGKSSDNSKIDLNRNGAAVDYTRPEKILSLIKDDRWRKFGENYANSLFAFIRPHYCNYLLRKWNEEHPDNKISSLQIIYMTEYTEPDYKKTIPVKNNLCGCVAEIQ
jgi:hypothetical protein